MEDRVDRAERKIKNVEEAIVLLTGLTIQHSGLLEKPVFDTEELKAGQRKLQEGQRKLQEKINILIDAQIRTEDQAKITGQKMAELAETVKLAH